MSVCLQQGGLTFNTLTCAVVSGCICGRLFALVSSYLVLQHYRCLSSQGAFQLVCCCYHCCCTHHIITLGKWVGVRSLCSWCENYIQQEKRSLLHPTLHLWRCLSLQPFLDRSPASCLPQINGYHALMLQHVLWSPVFDRNWWMINLHRLIRRISNKEV